MEPNVTMPNPNPPAVSQGPRLVSSGLGVGIIAVATLVAGYLIWSSWNEMKSQTEALQSIQTVKVMPLKKVQKEAVPEEPVVKDDGKPVTSADFDAEVGAMNEDLGGVDDADFGDGEISDTNLGI